MEYSLVNQGNYKLLRFFGNIQPSSFEKFRDIAEELDSTDRKNWVLDVSDFDYIDSLGLGKLMEINQIARQNGVSMSIKGANYRVGEMFRYSRFERIFNLERPMEAGVSHKKAGSECPPSGFFCGE